MKIQANKLMYGEKLVGYRFSILKDTGEKTVSLDVDKRSAKSFLSLVDRSNVEKGYVIQGEIVANVFITSDEADVIEITSANEAVEALQKYYYNCDNKNEGILDDIKETKEEENDRLIREIMSGGDAILEKYEYSDFGYVPLVYKLFTEASKDIPHRLFIDDSNVEDYYALMVFKNVFYNLKDVKRFLTKVFGICNIKNPEVDGGLTELFGAKVLKNASDLERYLDACFGENGYCKECGLGCEECSLGAFYIGKYEDYKYEVEGLYYVKCFAHTPGYYSKEDEFDVDSYDKWGEYNIVF